MAQILVRDLEEDVKSRLEDQARRHGRSTVEEVREILRNAVREVEAERGLGTRIVARFQGAGLDEDIPEIRGQAARAARFDP